MWYTKIDQNVLSRLNKQGSVLDFGCGDGGYSRITKDDYSSIHLFDFPEMVKGIPQDIREIPNVSIFSDWNEIRSNKYDEVIATLVFQHIHPYELDEYLKDISSMTGRLVVKSRVDFNPYIRKLMSFSDDILMPYLEKYFNVIEISYDDNSELFVGIFEPKVVENA